MSIKYHPETNVGIEIEICVENEFYTSLQSHGGADYYSKVYKYPEGEDPFRSPNSQSSNNEESNNEESNNEESNNEESNNEESNNEESNNEDSNNEDSNNDNQSSESSLRDIVLTEDLTCKCDNKKYISAEINSPRMNPKHIKPFMKFLKDVLFKDMNKIHQGGTCGIHVHWSNSALHLYPEMLEYNFEFIKVLYFLKKYIIYKTIATQFSGRTDFYDILRNKFIINLKIFRNDLFMLKPEIPIKMTGKTTLGDVKSYLEDMKIEIMEWKGALDTIEKKIGKFVDTLDDDEIDVLTLIIIYITCNNRNILDGAPDLGSWFIVKKFEDYPHDKLIKFYENNNLSKAYIKEHIKSNLTEITTIYKNPLPINEWSIVANFNNLSIPRGAEKIWGKSKSILTRDLLRKFNKFKMLACGKGNLNNIWFKKYPKLWDAVMRKKEVRVGDIMEIEPEKFIKELLGNFKKQPISLYDMKDFHMEMRLFSLDELFSKHGGKTNGKLIVEELNRFLRLTNTFMKNVLTRFNNFFDPQTKSIPESKRQFYEEYFLMDKEYKASNQKVKNKFMELFGIKEKKKSVLRSLKRSPKGSRRRSRKQRSTAN